LVIDGVVPEVVVAFGLAALVLAVLLGVAVALVLELP
jgi:hypothetical protein